MFYLAGQMKHHKERLHSSRPETQEYTQERSQTQVAEPRFKVTRVIVTSQLRPPWDSYS